MLALYLVSKIAKVRKYAKTASFKGWGNPILPPSNKQTNKRTNENYEKNAAKAATVSAGDSSAKKCPPGTA